MHDNGAISTYPMLTQMDLNHLTNSSQDHFFQKTQLKSNMHILDLLYKSLGEAADPQKVSLYKSATNYQ